MKEKPHYSKASFDTIPYTESDFLAIQKYREESNISIKEEQKNVWLVKNEETNEFGIYPYCSDEEALIQFAADQLCKQLIVDGKITWKNDKPSIIHKIENYKKQEESINKHNKKAKILNFERRDDL